MKHSLIDFVVINEGEKTLRLLLGALEYNMPFDNIENLGWKENGQIRINKTSESFIDLNELPQPAWDLIPVER